MTTQQVWTKYSDGLKKFIFSKVKNSANVDDILQDTFIKIHTKLHTLKDITRLKPWIFSIARNSIVDHFKRSSPTFEINDVEAAVEVPEDLHTEKDCLHGILKSLAKKYRYPLFLSDIKGLKQRDIATQMNLPLPTVKSRIQRARKQIAQGFMDCCGFVMNKQGNLVGEIQEKEHCKICN